MMEKKKDKKISRDKYSSSDRGFVIEMVEITKL